jgi:hypothetical protein
MPPNKNKRSDVIQMSIKNKVITVQAVEAARVVRG